MVVGTDPLWTPSLPVAFHPHDLEAVTKCHSWDMAQPDRPAAHPQGSEQTSGGRDPQAHRRVIVVGGGIGGLVAAHDLAHQRPDVEVLLIEAGDRVGGKLRLATLAGHQVDVGAEAMLAVRPEGVDLVRRLSAGDDLVSPVATGASIWSRGALHPLPRATLMGVPTGPEGLGDLLTPAELARLADEQLWPGHVETDVSVGDYVGTRLGRAVVDRLVEPLLGGVYAGRADQLSLRATMPALWAAAIAGESLTAAARRVAPAPTAGPSARPVFAGIVGGMGRLPQILVDQMPANVSIRTATIVRGLESGPDGTHRVLVGPTIAQEWIEASAVIIATPPSAAGRLLSSVAPGAAMALSEVPTASSAVVSLAFPADRMPDLPGSGFLVPAVDGHLVKGATFSGNKWAWTGALDPGLVFLRASIGRIGDEALLQRDDTDLALACVRELGVALAADLPAPVDTHVMRWGGGLPQYTVGHVDRMERIRAALAAVPGLEVSGAAYQGVGIPAVIATGRAAATAIDAHLRTLENPG